MDPILYKPIGVITSPFKQPKGTPIQSSAAQGVSGTVEIDPKYKAALKDLDGFSHIILLYHFHLSTEPELCVKPFLDNYERGLFATRAPARPNPIGISVVRLKSVNRNILEVEDVDIIDGTPLLDIKPYVPEFDVREGCKIGWLKGNVSKTNTMRDDGRFLKE